MTIAGYCRNMYEPILRIKQWYKSVYVVGFSNTSDNAGRIMSMKKSSDTIGNGTRDLPVCSAVPQPLRHRSPLYTKKTP
jgi:hypothetical protein